MTSEPPRSGGVLVYLDANVLVAGFMRTLVLMCGVPGAGRFRAVWSPHAEQEAERHQPSGATRISDVRRRFDLPTVPDAPPPIPFIDTDPKDRPILAAAVSCGARFVVTENIKDFGAQDLAALSMSAVHPDLLLTVRVPEQEYVQVLSDIAARRTRPPNTVSDLHAIEVARRFPRLFAAHQHALGVTAQVPLPGLPRLSFRGARCVRCVRPLGDSGSRQLGLGPTCRSSTVV